MSVFLTIAEHLLLIAAIVGLWIAIWSLNKEVDNVKNDIAALSGLLIVPLDEDDYQPPPPKVDYNRPPTGKAF